MVEIVGGATLKIHINEDSTIKETEISINCNRMNEDIQKLIAMLRVLDMKLTGMKEGQTYILSLVKALRRFLNIVIANKLTILLQSQVMFL